jgi:hypothetical protein
MARRSPRPTLSAIIFRLGTDHHPIRTLTFWGRRMLCKNVTIVCLRPPVAPPRIRGRPRANAATGTSRLRRSLSSAANPRTPGQRRPAVAAKRDPGQPWHPAQEMGHWIVQRECQATKQSRIERASNCGPEQQEFERGVASAMRGHRTELIAFTTNATDPVVSSTAKPIPCPDQVHLNAGACNTSTPIATSKD